jgi:hypothetical protein
VLRVDHHYITNGDWHLFAQPAALYFLTTSERASKPCQRLRRDLYFSCDRLSGSLATVALVIRRSLRLRHQCEVHVAVGLRFESVVRLLRCRRYQRLFMAIFIKARPQFTGNSTENTVPRGDLSLSIKTTALSRR